MLMRNETEVEPWPEIDENFASSDGQLAGAFNDRICHQAVEATLAAGDPMFRRGSTPYVENICHLLLTRVDS